MKVVDGLVVRLHEEYEKFRVKQDLEYVSDFDVTFERIGSYSD